MKDHKKIARYSLLISLFLIPFYFLKFSVSILKTNVFEISLLLPLATTFLYYLKSQKKVNIKLGSVWALLFILSVLFSVFISYDKSRAFGIFKGWFFVPYVLYLLTINLFTKKDFAKIITTILISAFLVSCWAILQRFGVRYFLPNQNDIDLQNFIKIPHPRVFGVFESPNYLAMFLAPIIFLSLILANKFKSPVTRVAIIIMIFCMSVTLYWTDSRSGIIAFLASSAFLLIRFLIAKKSLVRYVLMIFLVIFVVNSIYYFVKIDIHPNSEMGRKRIYDYSVQMVKHNPIFGVGLGDYSDDLALEAQNDKEFLVYFLPYAYHPHNLYLAIWLNLGLIGLIFFIILLAKILINISENFSSMTNVIIFSAILTILIQGIFDTNYFKNDLSAIFWLICALSYLAKSTNSSIVHKINFGFLGSRLMLDW